MWLSPRRLTPGIPFASSQSAVCAGKCADVAALGRPLPTRWRHAPVVVCLPDLGNRRPTSRLRSPHKNPRLGKNFAHCAVQNRGQQVPIARDRLAETGRQKRVPHDRGALEIAGLPDPARVPPVSAMSACRCRRETTRRRPLGRPNDPACSVGLFGGCVVNVRDILQSSEINDLKAVGFEMPEAVPPTR